MGHATSLGNTRCGVATKFMTTGLNQRFLRAVVTSIFISQTSSQAKSWFFPKSGIFFGGLNHGSQNSIPAAVPTGRDHAIKF
jgi:hypothetical protein